jgi:hypothetical protein
MLDAFALGQNCASSSRKHSWISADCIAKCVFALARRAHGNETEGRAKGQGSMRGSEIKPTTRPSDGRDTKRERGRPLHHLLTRLSRRVRSARDRPPSSEFSAPESPDQAFSMPTGFNWADAMEPLEAERRARVVASFVAEDVHRDRNPAIGAIESLMRRRPAAVDARMLRRAAGQARGARGRP